MCVGKKRGFISDDGTIDDKAYETLLTAAFESVPELLQNIIKNCFAGINDFGPEDVCEMKKRSHCLRVQHMMVNMILKL